MTSVVLAAEELTKATSVPVRQSVTGAMATTFAIGGRLSRLIEPNDLVQLQAVVRFLSEQGQSYRILGAGSNLLIDDAGLANWVVRLGPGFRSKTELKSGLFRIGAATSLMSLSRELSDAGYAGLEFAGGIPASIGGAVKMNAGAHGGEMSSVLRRLQLIDPSGECLELSSKQLPFSYRHSGIADAMLVVAAEVELIHSDRDRTRMLRAECLSQRKARQPLTMPSAGSVFKNPSAQTSAGLLIEQCGLKGRQIGGAEISALHANWIVNPQRRAAAKDVLALIALCQQQVESRFSVSLQPEIVRWSEAA